MKDYLEDYLTASLVIAYYLACICAFDRESRRDPIAWQVVAVTALFWIVVIPIAIAVVVFQKVKSLKSR